MDKNVEINLNEVVASTRQSASYIGSLLGKTFGKVECQLTWPGGKDKFEEAKNLASASNSLMLNMSPKRDAINDALRGTGKNFFVAIDETVSVLNEANKGTLAEIDALIKTLNSQRQSVETAISENLRKAAEYKRQWSESKIDNLEIKGNTGDADAIINVHTAE